MRKLFPVLLLSPFLSGCLTFNTLSYEIILEDESSGRANVIIRDIRSDAANLNDFREDTTKLFNDYLYGDDVLKSLKEEGKDIYSRRLEVEDERLNALAQFYFDDISQIENLIFNEGFYYLTLPLADSVVSTNGQIVISDDYKRILWDKNVDTLKFEMFSISFDDGEYRELAKYYKQK